MDYEYSKVDGLQIYPGQDQKMEIDKSCYEPRGSSSQPSSTTHPIGLSIIHSPAQGKLFGRRGGRKLVSAILLPKGLMVWTTSSSTVRMHNTSPPRKLMALIGKHHEKKSTMAATLKLCQECRSHTSMRAYFLKKLHEYFSFQVPLKNL